MKDVVELHSDSQLQGSLTRSTTPIITDEKKFDFYTGLMQNVSTTIA